MKKRQNIGGVRMFEEIGDSSSRKKQANLTTELSILPEHPISVESYERYEKHNKKSPKLKQNQLSIYGIELRKHPDNSIKINALIRSTVQKPIRLKKAPIILLNSLGQPIARHVFNLEKLGTLPPNSARPWTFLLPPAAFLKKVTFDEIGNNWALALEKKQKHYIDLEKVKGISNPNEVKKKIQKVIDKAPPLKTNEINFMGLSLKQNQEGGLVATLLIRNGTPKPITLKQVPLEIMDANHEVVARGTFRLDHLTIQANTSKPAQFTFPPSGILKKDMDLSRWKIYHVD